MAEHYGVQTAQGHLTVPAESKEAYAADVLQQLRRDAAQVVTRYPQKRSALLPLLHLVQSVDGYVTGRGIDFCAEVLDLETAEVSGVATFYTQYKRHPNGEYTVGVCINTLCAIMGGDRIWDEVSEHLGIGHDETTPDGRITLERIECNAACDYAPVVMANWEFFDNQTPESTKELVDGLRDGRPVKPTRGPGTVRTFKQVSRVLAGFPDGLADEGVGAGPASLVGLELAHANGWAAPNGADRRQESEAGDEAVPHDADAGAPSKHAEQSPHEAADPDKPVEASEKPASAGDVAQSQDGGTVPVEGVPAVVVEADTGTVDQPAAQQAMVAGDPVPVPVASAARATDAPTTPPETVAAQTAQAPDVLPGSAEPAQDSPGMTVPGPAGAPDAEGSDGKDEE